MQDAQQHAQQDEQDADIANQPTPPLPPALQLAAAPRQSPRAQLAPRNSPRISPFDQQRHEPDGLQPGGAISDLTRDNVNADNVNAECNQTTVTTGMHNSRALGSVKPAVRLT